MRGTRIMLGVVIALGGLILIGTAVVVATVVQRVAARHASVHPAAAQSDGPLRILSLAAAGGRLAVAVSTPAGDRLLLVDPTSGTVVARVPLAPPDARP